MTAGKTGRRGCRAPLESLRGGRIGGGRRCERKQQCQVGLQSPEQEDVAANRRPRCSQRGMASSVGSVEVFTTKMLLRVESTRCKKGGRSAEVCFAWSEWCIRWWSPSFREGLADSRRISSNGSALERAAARVSVHVRRDFNGGRRLRQ